MNTLTVRGWRAVPNPNGGFDIHRPGGYNTYSGWVSNAKIAEEWLEEASGVAYDRLPPVKRSELRVENRPRQPIHDSPRRKGDYVQQSLYYYEDKFLGQIQTKCQYGRYTTLTSVRDFAVIGSDVRWLCKWNGLRLVD